MNVSISTGNVYATNSRVDALWYLRHGWSLFAVPQMFGAENGLIVLCWDEEQGNHLSKPMSEADATRVLQDFETSSRDWYSSLQALESPHQTSSQP